MTVYFKAESDDSGDLVVVDVRKSPTPDFEATEEVVGIGFKIIDGVITPPEPIVSTEPVTLTRMQFDIALKMKGVTDGLDDDDLLAAVSAASPIGSSILKHAQSFASDDPLIDPVATVLDITFTTADWVNARANNFDLIS